MLLSLFSTLTMTVGTAKLSSDSTGRQRRITAPGERFPLTVGLSSPVGFLWAILLLGLVALITGANAQVPPPSCDVSLDYEWSYNSLGQDPCVVATYLGGACVPGYSIPPVESGFYLGPAVGQNTTCRCSSVFYMTLSACSACQGGSWPSWMDYNPNCTMVYSSTFPDNIPGATDVPQWAYLNITISGTFDPAEAKAIGDIPESTGVAVPTATTTSSSTSTPKKSHSESGPIAGGVVGGVIILSLCVVAVIYFRRRRSRNRGRGGRGKYSAAAPSSQVGDVSSHPYPMMSAHPEMQSSFTSLTSVARRLYDPSDPSTFPPPILSTSPPPLIPMRANPGHSPQASSETNNTTGYLSTGYHSVMPSTRPGYDKQGGWVAEV